MASPLDEGIRRGGLTPHRTTTVTFDHSDTVLREPRFTRVVAGSTMQPLETAGCQRLASGVWILDPVNDFLISQEDDTAQQYVLRLADLNVHGVVTEFKRQRKYTELSGIGADASVATSGDYFMRKRIAAGVTWNNSVGTVPNVYSGAKYPMDRLVNGATAGPFDADTGYMLYLIVPSAALTRPDFIMGFEFGGAVIETSTGGHTGYGRFYMILRGDGRAFLREYIDDAWRDVNEWRYTSPVDTTATAIMMRIIPHAPGFIEFSSLTHGYVTDPLDRLVQTAITAIGSRASANFNKSVFVHEIKNRGALQYYSDNVPRSTTGRGPIGVDIRRNLLCSWQVARLAYPASGTITDRSFTLPYGHGAAHVLWQNGLCYNFRPGGPDTTAVTGCSLVIQNHDGTALSTSSENFTWRGETRSISGYVPPGGLNKLRAVITLTNNETAGQKWHTPAFAQYTVGRFEDTAVLNPTAVTVNVNGVSITGPGYSPGEESANIVIEDVTNSLQFLRARGGGSVRIETTYDVNDLSKKVILFEGYIGRVTTDRKGIEGRVYPSPEWRMLDIDCLGKWDRIADTFFYQWTDYSKDYSAGTTASPQLLGTRGAIPWKITDIIRDALRMEGFAEDQLDIFEDDTRYYIPNQAEGYPVLVPPGTPLVPFITKLGRDYLNAFLMWDANAGAGGKWRLKRPPTGTETPRWSFVTTAPIVPGPSYRVRGAGYEGKGGPHGAKTSPILNEFKSYVIRPEGNVLTVSGSWIVDDKAGRVQVSRQLVNFTSFNAPAHPALADENDLDYLGYVKPVEYVDFTLSARTRAEAQGAVDFIANRIYQLALRGRKWFEFEAELCFIDGAALEPDIYTHRSHRPLMPGDLILIEGDLCILHAINPKYEKDHMQIAHYEAELFRPETTFY